MKAQVDRPLGNGLYRRDFALVVPGDDPAGIPARVINRGHDAVADRERVGVKNDEGTEVSAPGAAAGKARGTREAACSRFVKAIGFTFLEQLPFFVSPGGGGQERCRIDQLRQGRGGIFFDGARNGSDFLKKRHRVFPGLANPRARQDVVKLVEKHMKPGLTQQITSIVRPRHARRDGREGLCFFQIIFSPTVRLLDQALRRIATGEFEIQLMLDDRKRRSVGLVQFDAQRIEVFFRCAKDQLGIDRPFRLLDKILEFDASRAAAMIPYSVNHQPFVQTIRLGELSQGQGDIFGHPKVADVPGELAIDQNARTVRPLPIEERWTRIADHRVIKSSTLTTTVIIFYSALAQDGRKRDRMAKSIRLPIDRHILRGETEFLHEIPAGIEQMAGERLA